MLNAIDLLVQPPFFEPWVQDNACDMSHAEWLGLLLGHESANRITKSYKARLRAARLSHAQATIDYVDYRALRKLDNALMQLLATCRWIANIRNLLITGRCGIGKS